MTKIRAGKQRGIGTKIGAVDDIQFLAIDLAKLEAAPQKSCVLQLLSVLNDLDAGSYVNALLSEKEKLESRLVRLRWHDGVVLYLLRQQIATTYSALYDIIRIINEKVQAERLIRRSEKTPRLLWHMIVDNPNLSQQLTELVNLLSGDELKSLKHVRNKLAAHTDGAALSNGLKRIVATDYVGIVTRTQKPQRLRSLFVDDAISTSWQEKAIQGESSTSTALNFRNESSLIANKEQHKIAKRNLQHER